MDPDSYQPVAKWNFKVKGSRLRCSQLLTYGNLIWDHGYDVIAAAIEELCEGSLVIEATFIAKDGQTREYF